MDHSASRVGKNLISLPPVIIETVGGLHVRLTFSDNLSTQSYGRGTVRGFHRFSGRWIMERGPEYLEAWWFRTGQGVGNYKTYPVLGSWTIPLGKKKMEIGCGPCFNLAVQSQAPTGVTLSDCPSALSAAQKTPVIAQRGGKRCQFGILHVRWSVTLQSLRTPWL